MNRVVKLASIVILMITMGIAPLFAERKAIPLNQLTPDMLKLPKRIHILYFNEPVKKEVTIEITRQKMNIKIHYIQPKSFVNKLIRMLSDIDKNQKINGFESDAIYDYFHKEMIKNATIQLNGEDIKCKTTSQKIPDIYGPVDSREFEYYEDLECDLKNTIKFKKPNLLFLIDYVKLPAKQEKFESPVEVTIKLPARWKVLTQYSTKKGNKWQIISGIKLDKKNSAEIKFIPR